MDEKVLIEKAQIEINNRLNKYKGKKVSELKKLLGLKEDNTKASFVILAKKMLNEKTNQIALYNGGVNAVLKTVRLTGREQPAEAMSFMNINFEEWVDAPSWETSDLYNYFNQKYLIFFIFQQYPSGKRVDDSEMTFLEARVWKMTDYDLNHGLMEVWDEVRRLINNKELIITPIERKNGTTINKNNFPSSKFNSLGHLRPGGSDGNDKVKLPTGQYIVKQRFWFNTSYVKEIINL